MSLERAGTRAELADWDLLANQEVDLVGVVFSGGGGHAGQGAGGGPAYGNNFLVPLLGGS
jgi:hypothetical protein